MNRKWLLGLFAVLALSGCAMNKADEGTAGVFDRDKAMQEVMKDIQKVGFERQEVIPGIDGFTNSVAALLERQYKVLGEYRTVAESHTDVQAFLAANSGKSDNPQALQQAIAEFDAGAANESEKIGPKISAYKASTSSITSANVELGIELVVELAQSVLVLRDNAGAVAQAAAGSFISSFTSGSDEPNIGTALLRAKKQLELANQANKIIDADQKTIEAIDALEKELSGKG